MTPFTNIYEAFLNKVLDDEWEGWMQYETEEDLRQIMESAIPYFKFPRISLERNTTHFTNDLTSNEIQIIATYMKCEWLNRTILTYDNLKPLYSERDFSSANFLDKLNKTLEAERKNVRSLESTYYRSINGKPFRYRNMAGRPDEE